MTHFNTWYHSDHSGWA